MKTGLNAFELNRRAEYLNQCRIAWNKGFDRAVDGKRLPLKCPVSELFSQAYQDGYETAIMYRNPQIES